MQQEIFLHDYLEVILDADISVIENSEKVTNYKSEIKDKFIAHNSN